LKRAVVIIKNTFDGQQGSGFIIKIDQKSNELYILTAAHVIKDTEHPDIYFFGNTILHQESQILQQDKGIDLALLKVKLSASSLSEVISLNFLIDSKPFAGSSIYIIGIPLNGNDWSIIPCTVQAIESGKIKFSGNIGKGTSGSPVLYNGKIAGLVQKAGNQITGLPSEAVISDIIVPWMGTINSDDWIGQVNSSEFQDAIKTILNDSPNDFINLKGGFDHSQYDTVFDYRIYYRYYICNVSLPGFGEETGLLHYSKTTLIKDGSYDGKPWVELDYKIGWGYEEKYPLENIDESYIRRLYDNIKSVIKSELSDDWISIETPFPNKEFSIKRQFKATNNLNKQIITISYWYDENYQARIRVMFGHDCIKVNNYTHL